MEYVVSKDLKTGEKVLGRIAYSSLQECFNALSPGDRVYLKDEVYEGKLILRCKDITLIGSDESVITYDASNGEKIRECDGGDGHKVYGTTGSATFTVKPMASGFKMFNVTVQNTHGQNGNGHQAVAFKTEAEDGYYEECKFYGMQDTLYISSNDNIFYKCIVSGTIDFIFGSGNAILDKCNIVMRPNVSDLVFITAPSTPSVNPYGLFFYKCNVTTTSGDGACYLGRPWFDSGRADAITPRMLFYKCNLPSNLKLEVVKMKSLDGDYHEMHYFECVQNNKLVSSNVDPSIVDFYEKIYEQRR